MSRDVEISRQRMLKAQEAFLAHGHRSNRNAENQAQLIEELRKMRKDFLDSIDQIRQNPPTRLVPD
jgi:hypothetical protein